MKRRPLKKRTVLEQLDRLVEIRNHEPRKYDDLMVLLAQLVDTIERGKAGAR